MIDCGLFRLFGAGITFLVGCMFAVVCDFCGGCVCGSVLLLQVWARLVVLVTLMVSVGYG